MEKIKLAITFGRKSGEHPVSLHPTGGPIHKINKEHYELIFIGISKDGKWYAYGGDVDGIEHDTWLCEERYTPRVLSSSEGCRGSLKLHADGAFTRIEVDCIFLILHGKNGEDGTAQGLFELSGIPRVGCGHMSNAICMDKEMAHIIMEHTGIPCAPFVCVYEVGDLDYRKVYEYAKEMLGPPIFIRPTNAGSSLRIHRMESFDGFEEMMKDVFYRDGKGEVILETTIEGSEIGVAVMGNKESFVGSMDEIETAVPFLDYERKYETMDSHIYCPARTSPRLFGEARETAKEAYRAMNRKGMTRVDMFVTPEDTIILDEVNTIPGFTDIFRYPTMMKETGILLPELVDKLVALTMEE